MKLFDQIRRSPYQSLGIILASTITFTILLIFTTSILFVTSLVNYIKTQPQVSVYFLKTTPKDDIFKLREEILKTGKVRDVVYVSQEKALQYYKEITKNEPKLQEMATQDSLPESLEIYAQKPEYLKELADYAKKQAGVESVEFQEDLVGNIIKVTNGITMGLFAFLIAQLLIVFFIQFIVTAFHIVRKHDEIEIMRLLGASRSYASRPLRNMGLFLTAVSVFLSAVIVWGLYYILQPFIEQFLFGIPQLPLFTIGGITITIWPLSPLYIIGLMLITFLVGAGMTLLSTWFAARKYII